MEQRERPIIWNLYMCICTYITKWLERPIIWNRERETYYMEPVIWRPNTVAKANGTSPSHFKKKKKRDLLYGTYFMETYFIWRKRKGPVPDTLKKKKKNKPIVWNLLYGDLLHMAKEKGNSPGHFKKKGEKRDLLYGTCFMETYYSAETERDQPRVQAREREREIY